MKEIKALLKEFANKPKEMLKILGDNNFVFDNLEDRWQKLVFTFYSEICDMGRKAEAVGGEDE